MSVYFRTLYVHWMSLQRDIIKNMNYIPRIRMASSFLTCCSSKCWNFERSPNHSNDSSLLYLSSQYLTSLYLELLSGKYSIVSLFYLLTELLPWHPFQTLVFRHFQSPVEVNWTERDPGGLKRQFFLVCYGTLCANCKIYKGESGTSVLMPITIEKLLWYYIQLNNARQQTHVY